MGKYELNCETVNNGQNFLILVLLAAIVLLNISSVDAIPLITLNPTSGSPGSSTFTVTEVVIDSDKDKISDGKDNCKLQYNPDQALTG